MGSDRTILSQVVGTNVTEDSRQDTVTAFPHTTVPDLQLVAAGSPSYTLPPPYTPAARWAPIADGVVLWQGPDTQVRILDFDGTLRSTVLLELRDRFEITAEDREHWLQNAIPQEFMGQPVFEPVRRKHGEPSTSLGTIQRCSRF